MNTPKSLQRRIEALEQDSGMRPLTDAQILAWGGRVTDEELQALIDATEEYLSEHGRPDTMPPAISKADFWRLAMPFIEEMRGLRL